MSFLFLTFFLLDNHTPKNLCWLSILLSFLKFRIYKVNYNIVFKFPFLNYTTVVSKHVVDFRRNLLK